MQSCFFTLKCPLLRSTVVTLHRLQETDIPFSFIVVNPYGSWTLPLYSSDTAVCIFSILHGIEFLQPCALTEVQLCNLHSASLYLLSISFPYHTRVPSPSLTSRWTPFLHLPFLARPARPPSQQSGCRASTGHRECNQQPSCIRRDVSWSAPPGTGPACTSLRVPRCERGG